MGKGTLRIKFQFHYYQSIRNASGSKENYEKHLIDMLFTSYTLNLKNVFDYECGVKSSQTMAFIIWHRNSSNGRAWYLIQFQNFVARNGLVLTLHRNMSKFRIRKMYLECKSCCVYNTHTNTMDIIYWFSMWHRKQCPTKKYIYHKTATTRTIYKSFGFMKVFPCVSWILKRRKMFIKQPERTPSEIWILEYIFYAMTRFEVFCAILLIKDFEIIFFLNEAACVYCIIQM